MDRFLEKMERLNELANSSNTSTSDMMRYDSTPPYIKGGQMRDYQLLGLNWLISLQENGMNGILADEMGLGKPLQAISLIGYMKHYRKLSRPHLIIVPKKTLQNWIDEFARWCPSIKTACLKGLKEE